MMRRIKKLIADGYIEVCPSCDGLSAYAPGDVDEEHGVASIGAAGCWEWQCGHCGTYWMERDSPLNHPCYTHSED